MPVNYPEQIDVENAFNKALPSADELDQDQWNTLFRSITNQVWTDRGEGIQTIEVGEVQLMRIGWYFTVDRLNTASGSNLQQRSQSLKRELESLVNDEPICLSSSRTEVKEAITTTYTCMAEGIIGDLSSTN
jgi:hypothetical protein